MDSSASSPPDGGLAAARERGAAAQLEWVRAGEVVPVADLARRWGQTIEAVLAAARRGELCAVEVAGVRYVPKELLALSSGQVSAVSNALRGLDAVQQLVFWKRRHGALSGTTVLEVVQADPDGLGRVLALAESYAMQARMAATV